MEGQYNLRSPAVKRLMREAKELRNPTYQYYAQPLEDNLFEWHFTVRGPPESPYEGGIYHGRIMFPAEYPMKPPSVMLLTPNGRFEIGKKICLSISAYHPETWQPSWSIRTVLVAICGFMPTKGGGAIGALDYTTEERQKLARKSTEWRCSVCDCQNSDILLSKDEDDNTSDQAKQDKELASQISFKSEAEVKAAFQQQAESKPNTTGNEPSQPTQQTSRETPTPSLRQRPVVRESTVTTPLVQSRQQQSSNGGRGLVLLGMFLVFAILGLLIRRLNKLPEPHFEL